MRLWLVISVVVGFIRSADFSRHRATSNNVTGPEAICRKKSHSLSQKEQQLWNLGDGDRLNEQSSFCNEESELPVGFHRTAHASTVAIIGSRSETDQRDDWTRCLPIRPTGFDPFGCSDFSGSILRPLMTARSRVLIHPSSVGRSLCRPCLMI